MSKADEMFEKLGYKKSYTQLEDIKYYKDDDNVIYFRIKCKSFNKSGEYDGMCDYTTVKELQAISEKCEELGWLSNKELEKDKIREKINKQKELMEQYLKAREYGQVDIRLYKIQILEELLEEK